MTDQYEIHAIFRGNKSDYSPQLSSHIAVVLEFMLKSRGVEFDEVIVVK